MTRSFLVLCACLCVLGCSSSHWIADKPISYQNAGLLIEPIKPESMRNVSEQVFSSHHADSIFNVALNRVLSVPGDRYAGMTRTTDYRQSQFSLQLSEVSVSNSKNFLHGLVKQGPVYKVNVRLQGFRGSELIYDATASEIGNMAQVAYPQPGFKRLSEAERADLDLKRATLSKAYYSAVGTLLMDFFQLNVD